MQLLISDANILIDLEEGLLLEQMFRLPYEFAIPDILFAEELEEEHSHLPIMGLKLAELSPASMMQAMQLIPLYPKASRNDLLALCLAKQENCPLITGDLALRKAADSEAVVVNGTIWLVEQLILQHVISISEARIAYQKMQQTGRKLPWSLAENNLKLIEEKSLNKTH